MHFSQNPSVAKVWAATAAMTKSDTDRSSAGRSTTALQRSEISLSSSVSREVMVPLITVSKGGPARKGLGYTSDPGTNVFLQGPRVELRHSKNMNGEKNYTFIFIHLPLKFSISFNYESKQQSRVV